MNNKENKKRTLPDNSNTSFVNFEDLKSKQIKSNKVSSFSNMFSTCMILR